MLNGFLILLNEFTAVASDVQIEGKEAPAVRRDVLTYVTVNYRRVRARACALGSTGNARDRPRQFMNKVRPCLRLKFIKIFLKRTVIVNHDFFMGLRQTAI